MTVHVCRFLWVFSLFLQGPRSYFESGGGGGGLTTDSKWGAGGGGWKHFFLSNSL